MDVMQGVGTMNLLWSKNLCTMDEFPCTEGFNGVTSTFLIKKYSCLHKGQNREERIEIKLQKGGMCTSCGQPSLCLVVQEK